MPKSDSENQIPAFVVNDGSKAPEPEWYVVHTYSGHENKVRDDLEKRKVSLNMQDQIFSVLVPTEEEIEFNKDGKRKTILKKVYPGYVLVEMVLNDRSWYVVRNTTGVTGFVSPGPRPLPLPKDEVCKIKQLMGLETPAKVKIELEVGQIVRIVHGPLQGNQGTVLQVDPDREKIKIQVDMFGRSTSVDVDFGQVEKQS